MRADLKRLARDSEGRRQATAHKFRFADFDLDCQTGELYQHDVKLKLQGQPIEVLTLLVERRGELVTREELRQLSGPKTPSLISNIA